MKKSALLIAIAAGIGLTLTGCLDVVQYVSGGGSDEIEVYLRLTLQKSIFELAGSMGGEAQDLDQMFEEQFDLDEEDVVAELPPGVAARYERVNTAHEFGFVLSYSAPRSVLGSLPESEGAFVPRVTQRGMVIPLGPSGESGDAGDGDQFADAFLGSSKYRLMVSKRLVSRVSQAWIHTGADSVSLTVIDLPDIWLIEFPVSLWFTAESDASVEVVF